MDDIEFALTQGNAAAVVELCRRLEGLPLAIELAAARTRLLDPDALLDRLSRSLDALGTGAVDLPQRQHTLRTTVQWSVGLLKEDEQSLLEAVAVFIDGWTIPAARVAGLDEVRVLALCEGAGRYSLIYLDRTELGPRLRMLATIREFVAERLAARPDVADVERRQAGRLRSEDGQAGRPAGCQACRPPGRWAEADAADAIEFAAWTVDHARLAVLDAIDARAYADDLARSAGA